MKNCLFCGMEIEDAAEFCKYCKKGQYSSIDKRKFPRYRCNSTLFYRPLDDLVKGWKEALRTENISMGGLLFYSDEKLDEGKIYFIKIQPFIRANESEMIELRANIIESKEIEGGIRTRVKFVDLDEVTGTKLKNFIRNLP